MKELKLYNGNNQLYKIGLPKIVYLTDYINPVAIEHIKKNTGLTFDKYDNGYATQPNDTEQIVKLFLTYDFKTEYHNNGTNINTIFLKSMNNTGFKVNTICFKCCVYNNIHTGNMNKKSRMMV